MSDQENVTAADYVILEDNCQYFYTMRPFELKNVLGNIIAVLREFIFMKIEGESEHSCYKLYKTKDGNWYDIEELKYAGENNKLRSLKAAIDLKETAIIS